MWKLFSNVHRSVRGGLRASILEDKQGITSRSSDLSTLTTRTPQFTIPYFGITSHESQLSHSASKVLSQNLLDRRFIVTYQDEKGNNYEDYYENFTFLEALRYLIPLILYFEYVHRFKDDTDAFGWFLCPLVQLKLYKPIHTQPIQNGEAAIIDHSDLNSLNQNFVNDQELYYDNETKNIHHKKEDINVGKQNITIDSSDNPQESLFAKLDRFSDVLGGKKKEGVSEFELELSALEGIELLDAGNLHGIVVLQDLASKGSSVANVQLGMAFECGYLVKKNLFKARRYYESAARLGNPDAEFNLGVYYSQGLGGLQTNPQKAKQLIESAARNGCEAAVAALKKHRGDSCNESSAESCIPESVSSLNQSEDLFDLAKSFLLLGEMRTALDLFSQAAHQGHKLAKVEIEKLNSPTENQK